MESGLILAMSRLDELWWRLRFLEGVMLGLSFMLYKLMRILIEYYREEKKARRKDEQSPSSPKQVFGLAFHLDRRIGLFFGYVREKLSEGVRCVGNALPSRIHVARTLDRFKMLPKCFFLHIRAWWIDRKR